MNTTKHLRLIVKLEGSQFDLNLNLSTVFLAINGKFYPLEIVNTYGNNHTTKWEVSEGTYELVCDFEREAETKALFLGDERFDFNVNLQQILLQPDMSGEIDLLLNEEPELSKCNIERISDMYLSSEINKDLKIPVKHSLNW